MQTPVVHEGVTYNVNLGRGSWSSEHLKEVTLGEGISSVPEDFFNGLEAVTKLVIKEDVGDYCRSLDLRSCQALQELWLPATAGVEYWPRSYGQSSPLKKVYAVGNSVPKWTTSIPDGAEGRLVPDFSTATGKDLIFQEGDFSYTLCEEGKVKATAICSTATTATIPASVTHAGTTYSVASTGRLSSSTLTSLTLPASIEDVGSIDLETTGASVKIVGEELPAWVSMIDDDLDVFLAATATAAGDIKRFKGNDKCLYEVLDDNNLRLTDMSALLSPYSSSTDPISVTLPETVTHNSTTYTLTELASNSRMSYGYNPKVVKVVVPTSVTTVGSGALGFSYDRYGDDEDCELTVVVYSTTPLTPAALRCYGSSYRNPPKVNLNIVGSAWPDWVNDFTSQGDGHVIEVPNLTIKLVATADANDGTVFNEEELKFTEDKAKYVKLFPLSGKTVRMTSIVWPDDNSEVVYVPATKVTHESVEYTIAEVGVSGTNNPVCIVGSAWPEWSVKTSHLGSGLSLATSMGATEGDSKFFSLGNVDYTVTAQGTSDANGIVCAEYYYPTVSNSFVWPATVRFFGRYYDVEVIKGLIITNDDPRPVDTYTVPANIKRILGSISGMKTLVLPAGIELVPGENTYYRMSKIVVPGATEEQLTALRTLVNEHKGDGVDEGIEVVGTLETEFVEGAVTYRKLEPLTSKNVEIAYLMPATMTETVYVPAAQVTHGGVTYTITSNAVNSLLSNEVRIVGTDWPSWLNSEKKALSSTALGLAISSAATEGQAKFFTKLEGDNDNRWTANYTVTAQATPNANGQVAVSYSAVSYSNNYQIQPQVTFFGRTYDIIELRNLHPSSNTYSVPPTIKRIKGDISGRTIILPLTTQLIPNDDTEYSMSKIVVPGASEAQLDELSTLVNAHKADYHQYENIIVVATTEDMFLEGGVMYKKLITHPDGTATEVDIIAITPATATEVVYVPTAQVTHDGETYTVASNGATSLVSNEVRLIGSQWPEWVSEGKVLSSTSLTLAGTKEATSGDAKYFAQDGVVYTVTTAASGSAYGKVCAQGQNGLLASSVTLPATATCFGRTYDVEALNGLNISWPAGSTDKTYTVPASIKTISGSITGVETLVLAPTTKLQPADNDRYDVKSVVVPSATEEQLTALRSLVNGHKSGSEGIAVKGSLALPALEAQLAPARPDGIYSLSGERLAAPRRGLCIVVEDGQAKLRLYK